MMMMMMMMMMVFINDDDLVALFGVKKEQRRERFRFLLPSRVVPSQRQLIVAPLRGTQRVVVVVFFVHQNTFFAKNDVSRCSRQTLSEAALQLLSIQISPNKHHSIQLLFAFLPRSFGQRLFVRGHVKHKLGVALTLKAKHAFTSVHVRAIFLQQVHHKLVD